MWLSRLSSALENDVFFIIDDSDADLATFVLHENVTICKWNKWNEAFKSFLFPSLWKADTEASLPGCDFTFCLWQWALLSLPLVSVILNSQRQQVNEVASEWESLN